MYYTIYKITNKIDGKFYIGSHKTKNLDDDYMGSGKYLMRAQEKYGIENFTKDILYVFETAEEMYDKEAEIVNEDFLATENTYNLKVGGFGGWDYINSNYPLDRSELMKKARKKSKAFLGKSHSIEHKMKLSKSLIGNTFFKDKHHTIETKKIMSEKAKLRMSIPENNSQFGTKWITDGVENKKIKSTANIPDGWVAGRKIK